MGVENNEQKKDKHPPPKTPEDTYGCTTEDASVLGQWGTLTGLPLADIGASCIAGSTSALTQHRQTD